LQARKPAKVIAVALANKTEREFALNSRLRFSGADPLIHHNFSTAHRCTPDM